MSQAFQEWLYLALGVAEDLGFYRISRYTQSSTGPELSHQPQALLSGEHCLLLFFFFFNDSIKIQLGVAAPKTLFPLNGLTGLYGTWAPRVTEAVGMG
jgi:hypothetical protein